MISRTGEKKMPVRFFSLRDLRRILAFVPVLALLAAAAVTPATAQEDEPTELQKLFGAMGLLDLPKEPIDYSERSPLVVPPSADLAKPGGEVDVRALNPDWPVDQDIKRKKAAAKEAKKPIDAPNDLFYGSRLMQPKDWKQAKSKGRGEGTETWTDDEKRGLFRVTPDKLGFKGWNKKNEIVKFEGEPDRTSLLQPPPGYQTPSKNAPYGIVEDERVVSAPKDSFDPGNVQRQAR
jgi:hypothetical protein